MLLIMEIHSTNITVARSPYAREAAQRSVKQRMIAWNSDVLTAVARLWPYLAHSYVTTATEAT